MRQVFYIALNTYRESVRSKILYALLFFAAALILLSLFFGSVTIGDKLKVIKDFGLFSVSIFSLAFAVISGANLLFKELARKTVYNILSKPVHRGQFLLGKYFGMVWTAGVLVLIMGLGLSGFLFLLEGSVDLYLFQAYFYMGLELVIICAAAIFFSAIVVTPVLSGLFTFALFLAGRSTEFLLYFVREGSVTEVQAMVLKGLYWILPHFHDLNVSDLVVNSQLGSLSLARAGLSILYSVSYAAVLLVVASFLFRRREFN